MVYPFHIQPSVSTVLISNIAFALLFLVLAYIGIGLASGIIRGLANTRFESASILDFIENVSKTIMWFFTVLIVLSILGFSNVAASFGTASGFVALGVAYALKDVLADTVAGIYLVNDKDFEVGDMVEVDSTKGELVEIDLRKSRLRLDNGDLKVLRNSDVEKKWVKLNQ